MVSTSQLSSEQKRLNTCWKRPPTCIQPQLALVKRQKALCTQPFRVRLLNPAATRKAVPGTHQKGAEHDEEQGLHQNCTLRAVFKASCAVLHPCISLQRRFEKGSQGQTRQMGLESSMNREATPMSVYTTWSVWEWNNRLDSLKRSILGLWDHKSGSTAGSRGSIL